MNARPALNIQVTSYGEGADYRSAMWMGPEPRPSRETAPYRLRLEWPTGLCHHGLGTICWIGLNPSTADERNLDPTLRRIQRFSKGWGFSRFVMLNLFPHRATDPAKLWEQYGTGGVLEVRAHEGTLGVVRGEMKTASAFVLAWGDFSKCPSRGSRHGWKRMDAEHHAGALSSWLKYINRPVVHLGRTKSGQPKHPLARGRSFIPYDTPPRCVFTDEIVEWRS